MLDRLHSIVLPASRGVGPDDSTSVAEDQCRVAILVRLEEINSCWLGARIAITATAVLCVLGIGILNAGSVI